MYTFCNTCVMLNIKKLNIRKRLTRLPKTSIKSHLTFFTNIALTFDPVIELVDLSCCVSCKTCTGIHLDSRQIPTEAWQHNPMKPTASRFGWNESPTIFGHPRRLARVRPLYLYDTALASRSSSFFIHSSIHPSSTSQQIHTSRWLRWICCCALTPSLAGASVGLIDS